MRVQIITGLFLFTVSFSAFAQNNTRNAYKVPNAFLGHWQKGSFSLTHFEEANGKYVGPANEMSVSYVIKENGTAKEYFISNTTSYNCRTQILGFREGKIIINESEQSFVFQPSSGYYTLLSCMNKTATKKAYGPKDLYPAYQVKCYLKTDENGQPILVNNNNVQLKKIGDAPKAKTEQPQQAENPDIHYAKTESSRIHPNAMTAFSIKERPPVPRRGNLGVINF